MTSYKDGKLTAIAVIGFIPSVLSVYNWLTTTFSLPVANWFYPLLDLWKVYVVDNIAAFARFAPALMPDWSADFYALALVVGTIAYAAAFKYDRAESPPSRLETVFKFALTPFALVLMFAVPYLNVLMVIIMFAMVLAPMLFGTVIPQIMFQPHEQSSDEHSDYRRTRREYRNRQKFYWGICAGVMIAVVTNFF